MDMGMDMAALFAAAVFGSAVGAVTAYNAWAVFVSCRERYRAQYDRYDDGLDCLMASCEK
jgi:hypothetical protein